MRTVTIKPVHIDPEPEVIEIPEGLTQDYVDLIIDVKKSRYHRSHFKVTAELHGFETETPPVTLYLEQGKVSEAARRITG